MSVVGSLTIKGRIMRTLKRIDEKVIYPNLAKWMADNKIPKYKLAEMIGMSTKRTAGINFKLYGERDFSMSEIKNLLKVTGQTFEYLFREKDELNNEESKNYKI